MKLTLRKTILAIVALCLTPAAGFAYDQMAATIKISSGSLYDYVIIGESAKATDGFDNAYDTLAPSGNLNTNYISSFFSHPEWTAPKSTFRGDIRSLAEKQEWTLKIVSTLNAGSPLKIELMPGMNVLPSGLSLTITNPVTSVSTDLLAGGSLNLAAPAPGSEIQLIVTALQVSGNGGPVTPSPTTSADGDISGSCRVEQPCVPSTGDALTILRMALGLERITASAITHGDMNGDGKLSVVDALAILKKSVGM